MVFDNADVLSPAELEAYLPPGRGGNILITSRNSAMQSLTLPENSLELTEMKENDAIELLLKSSCLDPSRMDFQADALEIVKELFCVPLAIDQAGAYIASGATSIGDYLAKYLDHRKTLLFILNLLGLLSITELCMKLGSCHAKKFNKGLNLIILIRPM